MDGVIQQIHAKLFDKEMCEENYDSDEEPSYVEAEEGSAAGTEEITWYWDFKTGLWFS